MSAPQMAVVTGTRNREESFDRFFRSAFQSATIPTEIIIADASDEQTYTHNLMERVDNPLVIEASAYHDFPRTGVNLGYHKLMQKGSAPYVTFFNDDAELLPGWDRIAVDFMDANPEVGIGCLWWKDPGGRWYVQSFQKMIYPNFGCVRRTAGDKFGWFETRSVFIPELGREESIKTYGMDTALAFKCIDAGFGCVPIPDCKVLHHREPDLVRQQNYNEHCAGPRGNTAGIVLDAMWNSTPELLALYGRDYGWRQLREKYEKFRHLIPTSEYLQE